jgi:hypothetical protein
MHSVLIFLRWMITKNENEEPDRAATHLSACSNQLKYFFDVAIDWVNIFDLISE